MPASNPRLSITITPSVAAVLRELAGLTGNSQSALVGELLEAQQPIFERMVVVLQAARKVTASARVELSGNLEQAQQRLEEQLGFVTDEFEAAARPVLEAAERIDRRVGREGMRAARPPRPSRRADTTPMSNRGVTPHRKGKKTTAKGGGDGPL